MAPFCPDIRRHRVPKSQKPVRIELNSSSCQGSWTYQTDWRLQGPDRIEAALLITWAHLERVLDAAVARYTSLHFSRLF